LQFELEIVKLVPPGDGMGYYSGKAVFVPAASPGDIVRVFSVRESKTTITAALQEVLTPSPDRRPAACPHYLECGGCSLMHLDYDRQLLVKRQMLKAVLQQHGLDLDAPVLASPATVHFRHKSRIRCEGGRIGFSERNSNRVVEIPECRILAPGILAALQRLARLGRSAAEFQLLESWNSGEVAVSLQSGKRMEPLPGFSQSVTEDYGFGKLVLHSHGFAQSSPPVTAMIIRDLLAGATGSRRICELFCGCGTFSLPLAGVVEHLTGYDVSGPSIHIAVENAERLALRNTRFEAVDLNRIAALPAADTIVADPPRKGLGDRLCQLVMTSGAEKLLYVSCNPASLARDLKTLLQPGAFTLADLKGYDMYCHATHLELMAVLTRQPT